MAQRRRDSQEGIFTKLKSDNQLDYVPTPTWASNQIYLLSMLLAHNLGCAGDRPSSLAHNARETIRSVGLRTPGYPTASAYAACAGRPDPTARPAHSQSVRKPRRWRRAVSLPGGLESCLKSANYENLCNVGVYLNHRGGDEHGRLGDLDHRSRRITGRATEAAEHGGAH